MLFMTTKDVFVLFRFGSNVNLNDTFNKNVKVERNAWMGYVSSHFSISECCVCMKFVHLARIINLYFLEKLIYTFFTKIIMLMIFFLFCVAFY